ncbi:unnamed protein product [Meloidogyne enterolobii]|uniref:Uncharacterized protein n=1 Tax=Meloidogyne enterolobii TaxID=390850 RepID=A0ACB1A824_MELEN
MYIEYLKEPKDDLYLRKLSLASYSESCKIFLTESNYNFFGSFNESQEGTSIDIENDENKGISFSDEYKITIKNFKEKLDKLDEEIEKYSEEWPLEKQFCKLYSLIYALVRNKILMENKRWKEELDKNKSMPRHVRNLTRVG